MVKVGDGSTIDGSTGCKLAGNYALHDQGDSPSYSDYSGESCHFCHRLMGQGPQGQPAYTQNANAWLDDGDCNGNGAPCRRGPYDYAQGGAVDAPLRSTPALPLVLVVRAVIGVLVGGGFPGRLGRRLDAQAFARHRIALAHVAADVLATVRVRTVPMVSAMERTLVMFAGVSAIAASIVAVIAWQLAEQPLVADVLNPLLLPVMASQ